MTTFAERFGYTPKLESAKPCWLLRKIDQPNLIIWEGEKEVIILQQDATRVLLTRQIAKKVFRQEYTTIFPGRGAPPTVSEVAEVLHSTSSGISLSAVHLLQELGMTTKAKAAPKTEAKATKAKAEPKPTKKAAAAPAPEPATPAPTPAAPAKEKGKRTPKEGSPGAYDENTKLYALVKEDDEGVRLQDGSKRTAVFRAVAKGGKAGTTLGKVIEETKQSISEVRGALRVLVNQKRVGNVKPA